MKAKCGSLVLHLGLRIPYFAFVIIRVTVILARAIFAHAGNVARVWTRTRAIAP